MQKKLFAKKKKKNASKPHDTKHPAPAPHHLDSASSSQDESWFSDSLEASLDVGDTRKRGRPNWSSTSSSEAEQPVYKRRRCETYSSESDSEDDFMPDASDEAMALRENAEYERGLEKGKSRASKPNDFVARNNLKSKRKKATSPPSEKEVVKARKKRRGNAKKLKFPSKLDATARFESTCGRCNDPIYMDKHGKELGVGIGRDHRRQAPPHGHKIDYVQYEQAMEDAIADDSLSEEQDDEQRNQTRQMYRRYATWDNRNIRDEHLDCNATAKKITKLGMTAQQKKKGQKYVSKNHDRWKERARRATKWARASKRPAKHNLDATDSSASSESS